MLLIWKNEFDSFLSVGSVLVACFTSFLQLNKCLLIGYLT